MNDRINIFQLTILWFKLIIQKVV